MFPNALLPCLLLLLLQLGAGGASADPSVVQGRCEVSFSATSTLHDFAGSGETRPFALERHADDTSGESWWSGVVELPVDEITTGLERRDANMRSMFEASRYPNIEASFPHVELAPLEASNGRRGAPLDFELTIREVTRTVRGRVSRWVQHGPTASFDVTFDVSLPDFDLEAPAVLGVLRVGDVVHVRTRVTVELPSELADAGRGPA